ncbi:hypothetical protein OTU49_014751 [Cherax quadricarinatus]|uniref:Uncharacterized protein n=1 Tax=Cherax quadricarinatus TaxID=27406 RepID=A0AAW0VNC1_CHEQU
MMALIVMALCLVLLYAGCEAGTLSRHLPSFTTHQSVRASNDGIPQVNISQQQSTPHSTKHITDAPSPESDTTDLSSTRNCIVASSTKEDVIEVLHQHNQFLVIISSDFQYLETSLKIGSCSHESIYRANRFLTRNTLHLRAPDAQAVMKMNYTKLTNGAHAYRLTLDSFNFSEIVSTSVRCGKVLGFHVKAKGAAVCDLNLMENPLGIRVSELKSLLKDPSKSLLDLRYWSQGAYVIGVCFTLTSYLLFLVTVRLFRSNFQYQSIFTDRYLSVSCSKRPESYMLLLCPLIKLYITYIITSKGKLLYLPALVSSSHLH